MNGLRKKLKLLLTVFSISDQEKSWSLFILRQYRTTSVHQMRRVLHYCNARLNGDVQAAKDCTQEVFLILYQKMNKLNLSLNMIGRQNRIP